MIPAIQTEKLTKYYGAVIGVQDLNLTVLPGQVFGFLGPNGAGKTTTIRLLLDLLRPSSGRAMIAGLDCRSSSLAVRAQVGYLPGDMPIYPEMTGLGYLTFLSSLQRAPTDRAWLETLLSRFDVGSALLQRRMRELSHGTKRKLGIIQALMARPPLVILDEPTSGLDPLMIEAFAATIQELKASGRTTVFLSSHVLSEVERLCDGIGIVRRGQLVEETSLADLRQSMPRRVRVRFRDAPAPSPPRLPTAAIQASGREWTVNWRGPLGELLAVLNGLPVDDLEVEPFKLEEYVLGHFALSERSQEP